MSNFEDMRTGPDREDNHHKGSIYSSQERNFLGRCEIVNHGHLVFQLTMLYLQRFGAQIKDTYYEEVPGSVQLLLNELPFHVQKPAVKRGLTRLLDCLRDTASNVLFRWIIPGSIENRKPSPTTSESSR